MRRVGPRILLAIALTALPLLFLGGPDLFATRSGGALWDGGHALLFFCLVSGALGVRPESGNRPWVVAAAVLATALLLAVVVEWLQGFVGRGQSMKDVWASLAGAALGLMYSPLWGRLVPVRFGPTPRRILSAALVVIVGAPAAIASCDEWRARRDFPVLSDFRSPLELDRWAGRSTRSRQGAVDGEHNGAMLVRLEPGRSAGFQLTYFPRDWRGYQALVLRLRYDGEPMGLTCRLNDVAHDVQQPHESSDHYDEHFDLRPGWQEIRIDLEVAVSSLAKRRMDLDRINSLNCLFENLDRPVALELDRVELRR